MPRLSEGGLRLTLTNEVRGGSPPFGPTPRAPLDAPDHDPNYQRIKRFYDAALRREQNCTGEMAMNAHIERLILQTILEGWR